MGKWLEILFLFSTRTTEKVPRGGTDLERGYGDVQPWRPPFHTSPVVRKGPISSKSVSSQDPLLRKFWNFSLYSLNFCPNFSSQALKFGNFQFTSPQIWKFSVYKPPLSEANISSQAPHFGNLGRTPLPEKKLSAPRVPIQTQKDLMVTCSYYPRHHANCSVISFKIYSKITFLVNELDLFSELEDSMNGSTSMKSFVSMISSVF